MNTLTPLRPKSLSTQKSKVTSDWRLEHAKAKLSILEQGIQDALYFLKKRYPKNWLYKHKLPWFLVLGEEQVGKTALLAMSQLGLCSIDEQPLSYPNLTAYCDWWFNQHAMFLDVSGSLMLPEDPKNDSHYIWQKFISLLNRYRRLKPINGLLICIDLQRYMSKNRGQRQLYIDMLRHRIQTITQYVSTLPVYLIFTKCDQVVGFTDSFYSLSPEDCLQPFGVTLPAHIPQQNLAKVLEIQLRTFLQRLNDQLIARLHQEHNIEKRARIKDFPLQLEAIQRDLINLATQLNSSKASVVGLYFTSSLQDGKSSNGLTSMLYTFGLPHIPYHEQAPQQKAFFIHQILQQVTQHKAQSPQRKLPPWVQKLQWRNKSVYLSALGIALLLGTWIIPGYYYNKNTMEQIQSIMSSYQPPTDTSSITAILSPLNTLQQAYDAANQHAVWLFGLSFTQGRDLKNSLANSYTQALNSEFAPQLQHILENTLQTNNPINPLDYFAALKVYLMLQDPTHFDANFIQTWFAQQWKMIPGITHNKDHELNAHLAYFLNQKSAKFSINPQIVTLARQRLNSLPLAQLAYISLQAHYQQKHFDNTATPITNPAFPSPIDPLYSVRNFNHIYRTVIPEVVQALTAGDEWVLDLKLPSNLQNAMTDQLIDNVRIAYIQHYADFWQNQLMNIHLNPFHSLEEARDLAANWYTNASVFLSLLNQAQDQLSPIMNRPQAQEVLSTLQQLHDLLTQPSKTNAIQTSLNNLVAYLDHIMQNKDRDTAILTAAQQRMKHPGSDAISALRDIAPTAAAPLNNWLSQLALNSWRSLLESAHNQLNVLWLTEVLPVYQEQITQRYPLFPDSDSEIKPEDFTRFFGNNGVLDAFVKNHLAGFIDNSQLYWRWKTLDGENLNIPQSKLEMLDRANLLRQMYFTEHGKQPEVKFTLTPLSMDLMGSDYLIESNGQTVSYLKDLRQAKKFTWTSNQNDRASFSLYSNGQKTTFFQESGPWALFKLLARGSLTTSASSQVYTLNFNVNGVIVPYQLFTTQALNPFIPNMVSGFRCPEQL